MNEEEAIEIIREIKKDNESKIMIINTNTSNIQIRWSNKDLKEMAEISNRCAKENRAIETVLSMLEEKDKTIDLMSEAINNNDIDEDICRRMGQKEECNEFEDKEKCKECIKQYFENKAKEVK